MAAPRKYDDKYRETVLRLVIDEHRTIAEAVRLIAAGHQELEPLNLSPKTAGDWVKAAQREDRPDLSTAELPQILDTAARGLFEVVITDIYRQKNAKGKADPEELLTLAKTLKELQPLASLKPRTGKDETPQGLLGNLNHNGQDAPTVPTHPKMAAVRSLRE